MTKTSAAMKAWRGTFRGEHVSAVMPRITINFPGESKALSVNGSATGCQGDIKTDVLPATVLRQPCTPAIVFSAKSRYYERQIALRRPITSQRGR